jgi:predicted RNA-binding Zn ribbon-like protein
MTRRWIFHRSGGSLCLDLANTVSWRRSDQPIERLPAYGNLVEWARQSDILTAPAARALEREARRRPAMASRILARTRALREAIYRVFAGLACGRPPEPTALAHLDREFHDALRHLHLSPMRSGFMLAWPLDGGPPLALPLWAAARSAADVLTSANPRLLKTCPASNCGWIFLDTTRSGTRRWCDMRVCGSRAKARSYYARRRGSRASVRTSAAASSLRRTARGHRA